MTLADLAAILGLAVLAMVYVGFRLGERGGCPNCHGPGACGGSPACDREAGTGSDRGGGGATETRTRSPRGGGKRE